MRRALLLVALLGCKRSAKEAPPTPPSATVSVVPFASAPPIAPMVDASAHVAILEEVAAVHAKKLPCAEVESTLSPLRTKMNALGDLGDPRLVKAIEGDQTLSTRRARALGVIMDGAMRCRPPVK